LSYHPSSQNLLTSILAAEALREIRYTTTTLQLGREHLYRGVVI